MATHIVSWGGNEHVVSPASSSAPSILSVDSVLSLERETSVTVQEFEALATGLTPAKVSAQCADHAVEPIAQMTNTADDSFTRHHKYFFKDGNVTFLVDGTLYCVHRYFFSRDSVYFSTRFDELGIRYHEALPITISLSNVERKDLDALLSILYPENFEQHELSYEEWKSVLHLSTRWDLASIRRLALNNIQPPTPYDRLLLARTYSVDDWVIPALSALCERRAPLSLDEARQMDIEDVVLVATVREDIRNHALQVDAAEIPLRVEAAQAGKLVHDDGVGVSPAVPKSGTVEQASSSVDQKRASKGQDTGKRGGKVPRKQGAVEDIGKQIEEPPQTMDDCQAEEIARQKAEIESARRKVEETMRNASSTYGMTSRWEGVVRQRVADEERAAGLKVKAEDAKCKADAAKREADAATVVALEAAPGLEKAAASEVARVANEASKHATSRAYSTRMEAESAARNAARSWI